MSSENLENQTIQIARFAAGTEFDAIPGDVIERLKIHLLDAVGSLIQAQQSQTIAKMVSQLREVPENGKCRVPVLKTLAMDRAAQFYTALIRYPDFMDNFIGKEATCHPSDNIGPLLAAGQLNAVSGRAFLTAMALGYAIECRLIEEVPVMINGFDHTVLYAYSVTAALCKILQLDIDQTAHALGMAGCMFNPLVTSRVSYTYEWKGLASSMVAFGCSNTVLLARQGVTGPVSIFEGPKGFNEVMDMKLTFDWRAEDFSLIRRCCLKSYNAEVHTQSGIEAALELKEKHRFEPGDVEEIHITTFLTCYHIVGGGAYGDRKNVFSKEQADHSLPYVIAAAILDGQVYPEQLLPERIVRPDVQQLLQKVNVHTALPLHKPLPLAGLLDPYTAAYPEKTKTKLEIKLKDGETIALEKDDFKGFFTRPFNREDAEEKFYKLTGSLVKEETKTIIIEIIRDLENRTLGELIDVLAG